VAGFGQVGNGPAQVRIGAAQNLVEAWMVSKARAFFKNAIQLTVNPAEAPAIRGQRRLVKGGPRATIPAANHPQ